ncbi:MAG: sigma-70 family RNA polymerase sigma factor [Alphaproteobacteria bacterium]
MRFSNDKQNVAFVRSVMIMPLLEQKMEFKLIKQWQKNRDQKALHTLISSYIKLVVGIAARYRNYDIPIPDLIQEGTLGLFEATNRFDVEYNVRFSSYAKWWVRSFIKNYIFKNRSIVQISPLYKGNSNNFSNRNAIYDLSLNTLINSSSNTCWQDLLPDTSLNPEGVYIQKELKSLQHFWINHVAACLNPKEHFIIKKRYLSPFPPTLEALGKRMGIDKERVHKIEKRSLRKMRYHCLTQWRKVRQSFEN